jgi:AcrR family transcriptional regulator
MTTQGPGSGPQEAVQPSADSTTERILHAALKVYTEAGFRGTTTRRVAVAAGVNEITLFRQFGTKEGMIKAALAAYRPQKRVPLAEPVDPAAELEAWAWNLFSHWYEARDLICQVMGDLVEHPEIAPTVCEEPGCEHQELTAYLDRMRERGLAAAPAFRADAAAGMLIGAIFTHAVWRDYWDDPAMPPADAAIREFVSLLLGAVGYRGPAAPAGE